MLQNDFTRHEALHMSLFLAESVEAQLINNSFIQSDTDCAKLAQKANELLLELYQKIGQQHLSG